MAETPSHKRAKGVAAGWTEKKEVPLSRGLRLDAATPSKATEIERSGSMSNLQKAARRLKASDAPQKTLKVPHKNMDAAADAMRAVDVPGTVKNLGGTASRRVRPAKPSK